MQNIERMSQVTMERRFEIEADFNEAWFRSYVNELARYAEDVENVDCEVRLRPDTDNCIKFRDRNRWIDFVVENWSRVSETNIWQNGKPAVPRARCHHLRQNVLVGVSAGDAEDAEKVYRQLCGTLSLSVSRNLPYRYRRSSIEFEVGNWRPDLFVAGVKRIAALLGSDPDIPEAYAKSFEGDIEKVTSFFELQNFCDEIGTRASRFGEIAVRMDARGTSVGIGVPSDHKKLRIRTSIAPDKLDNIIDAWPHGLKLRAVKATDTGAGAGGGVPAPSENPWLKYGLPVAVAFVTGASAAGLVNFQKVFWPDYKVIISSPIVEKGVAKVVGNNIVLDWYLQPEQPSFRAVQKDVLATVRVHTPSGFQPPTQSKPPLPLSLDTGDYEVFVDVPEYAPVQFQVMVRSSSSQF